MFISLGWCARVQSLLCVIFAYLDIQELSGIWYTFSVEVSAADAKGRENKFKVSHELSFFSGNWAYLTREVGTMALFHRNRKKNPKICVERQKTLNH